MSEVVRKPVTILVADDDMDDRLLIKEAFEACQLPSDLRFVEDGVALMSYLNRRGNEQDKAEYPSPALILLDLKMPKMDGWEVLAELKANPILRIIPVIVLTTSSSDQDILRSYALAAASYITKPASLEEHMALIQALGKYWLETVKLPPC